MRLSPARHPTAGRENAKRPPRASRPRKSRRFRRLATHRLQTALPIVAHRSLRASRRQIPALPCRYHSFASIRGDRNKAPHVAQCRGIPSRHCRPRLASQSGQRFLNCSRHNTIAAPKTVPMRLFWVDCDSEKNSMRQIVVSVKSQNTMNSPIVAWWWRNRSFRSSLVIQEIRD